MSELVPISNSDDSALHAAADLELLLMVQVPMQRLRVADLAALRPGSVLFSSWTETSDLPLGIAGLQLAWCEFAPVADKLGVRLMRTA